MQHLEGNWTSAHNPRPSGAIKWAMIRRGPSAILSFLRSNWIQPKDLMPACLKCKLISSLSLASIYMISRSRKGILFCHRTLYEMLSSGMIPVAHWPLLAVAHWWIECPLSVPWLCGCWCSLSHSAQLEIKEKKEPSEKFLGFSTPNLCSPLSQAANRRTYYTRSLYPLWH